MNTKFILILIVLLSSCSTGGKKNIDKLYYRFPEAISLTHHLEFSIPRPSAMGILGNRPMVAQNDEEALLQLNHNFWLDSPKVLLQNYLVKAFKTTTSGKKNALNVMILNLEKKGETSVVSFAFSLVDSNSKTLFQKTYKIQNQLMQNTMSDFVKSVGQSIETIVKQLSDDLK